VLYNVSHDYDSATEAFEKAMRDRPDDHTLWNKVRRRSLVLSCHHIGCPAQISAVPFQLMTDRLV
jgi:hypothetical protein